MLVVELTYSAITHTAPFDLLLKIEARQITILAAEITSLNK